ncbi:hypothetical protein BV900_09930 [Agrobacterium tumefaciens]|nr:hypothetical protein BV900_09930 [Agrobacterium tumefaciens]
MLANLTGKAARYGNRSVINSSLHIACLRLISAWRCPSLQGNRPYQDRRSFCGSDHRPPAGSQLDCRLPVGLRDVIEGPT